MSRHTMSVTLPEALHELIEEGLRSDPGQALTTKRARQLKKQALGDLR